MYVYYIAIVNLSFPSYQALWKPWDPASTATRNLADIPQTVQVQSQDTEQYEQNRLPLPILDILCSRPVIVSAQLSTGQGSEEQHSWDDEGTSAQTSHKHSLALNSLEIVR